MATSMPKHLRLDKFIEFHYENHRSLGQGSFMISFLLGASILPFRGAPTLNLWFLLNEDY